ncbi:hypothetical protein BJX76DRAFT_316907 [Aspergillus varians]
MGCGFFFGGFICFWVLLSQHTFVGLGSFGVLPSAPTSLSLSVPVCGFQSRFGLVCVCVCVCVCVHLCCPYLGCDTFVVAPVIYVRFPCSLSVYGAVLYLDSTPFSFVQRVCRISWPDMD